MLSRFAIAMTSIMGLSALATAGVVAHTDKGSVLQAVTLAFVLLQTFVLVHVVVPWVVEGEK